MRTFEYVYERWSFKSPSLPTAPGNWVVSDGMDEWMQRLNELGRAGWRLVRDQQRRDGETLHVDALLERESDL